MLYKYGQLTCKFSSFYIFILFQFFGSIFNNTIISLAFPGYEMIIANLTLFASLPVYHVMSNAANKIIGKTALRNFFLYCQTHFKDNCFLKLISSCFLKNNCFFVFFFILFCIASFKSYHFHPHSHLSYTNRETTLLRILR